MDKRIRRTLNHRPPRVRRKLIILGTEGKNKTESLYFSELEKKQTQYHFIFTSCNNTDPIGIINSVAVQSKKEKISRKYGDFSAVVFDLDLDQNKIKNMPQIISLANKNNINIYASNPCFELWFLLHFTYSTKPYNSNEEIIKELRKYIPDYEKSKYVFNILDSLTLKAISNARQMQTRAKEINGGEMYLINNPNTDVFVLVEKVLPLKKKGGKEKNK